MTLTWNSSIMDINIDKYKVNFILALRRIREIVNDNKGISILLFTIVLALFTGQLLASTAVGAVFYTMTLLRELLNHKIESDNMEALDLHYFETAKNELEDPLDGYIDMCINEYMILYRGYKDKQYIQEKEEALIRKEILDLLASNMSPLMQRKFEQYYGRGRLPGILARKCFIRISLYVAQNNKDLYAEGDSKKANKDIEQLFSQMMYGAA